MKVNYVLVYLLFLISVALSAVTGKVVDVNGNPLKDVFVYFKVANASASTNALGEFSLAETPLLKPISASKLTQLQVKDRFISFDLLKEIAQVSLTIVNSRGELVYSKEIRNAKMGSYKLDFSRNLYAEGVYFAQLKMDREILQYQFHFCSHTQEFKAELIQNHKAEASVDSVVFLKADYENLRVAVSSYTQDLGSLVLKKIGLPEIVKVQTIDTSVFMSLANTKMTSLAPWQDFRKGAWSLTFDDGFSCHADYARPLLKKYGLKGTFFVVAGFVQDTRTGRYGSWNDFKLLADDGHEIGSHTISHTDLTTLDSASLILELDSSAKLIRSHFPGNQLLSMATPYVVSNEFVRKQIGKFYLSSRDAGNTGLTALQYSKLLQIPGFDVSYPSPRTLSSDSLALDKLQKSIETGIINKGAWNTQIIHELVPLDTAKVIQGWHPNSVESFDAYFAWLKQKSDTKDLWVAPMGTVSRYMAEASQLKIGVTSESSSQIQILAEDGLNDFDFNVPLSVEFSIPFSWGQVIVTQTGMPSSQTITVNAGKVRFNFLPNGKAITISPAL